jgi:hypothetical protein
MCALHLANRRSMAATVCSLLLPVSTRTGTLLHCKILTLLLLYMLSIQLHIVQSIVLGTLGLFALFSSNYAPPHEQAKATLRKHMTAVRPAGEAAALVRRRTSAAVPQQQQQQQPREHTH